MTPAAYYRPLIVTAAAAASLDPDLVEAIVWQESAYQTSAYRFEPAFWRTYLAPKPEWRDRLPQRVSASYGLCQVMFPVAVERGFIGAPEELCVPEVGLAFGCAHLAYLVRWATSTQPATAPIVATAGASFHASLVLRSVLAAYNGGKGGNAPDAEPDRNRAYAEQVLAKLRIIQQRQQTLTV